MIFDKYDFVVVGAGLYGCTVAYLLRNVYGKNVLVFEKNDVIGGLCRTESIEGIVCHVMGAHVFRTNSKKIYDFISKFGKVKNYYNRPIADTGSKYVRLPFCTGTIYDVFGYDCVRDIRTTILKDCDNGIDEPKNLKEYCLKHVGRKIYEELIEGYTEKQWGVKCSDIDVDVINELPIRMSWNNDYFDEEYQFVPVDGYSKIMEKMLDGIDVVTGMEVTIDDFEGYKGKIVFSGLIDRFFKSVYGDMEYRSVMFTHEIFQKNQLMNAVMNFPRRDVKYTRMIEHKYFYDVNPQDGVSVVSKEYPCAYKNDINEPCYNISNK